MFQSSENQIFKALQCVGANDGALRCDKTEQKYGRCKEHEDEDKELEKVKDATQTFLVASVLIATVAFGATFAVPGGYRADDHTNGGTPTLAGRYIFDAFMMATTLAFICSSIATIGFIYAGAPMINLDTRKANLVRSFFFMSSSVTSLFIAFALGVYMVLAPVAHNTAIAVCVISPLVALSTNMEYFFKVVTLARPLCIRMGRFPGIVRLLCWNVDAVVTALWPFVVSFSWAAFARVHSHR